MMAEPVAARQVPTSRAIRAGHHRTPKHKVSRGDLWLGLVWANMTDVVQRVAGLTKCAGLLWPGARSTATPEDQAWVLRPIDPVRVMSSLVLSE